MEHSIIFDCHWLVGPVVRPQRHYNLLKSWLEQDLFDLSISRPSTRLSWGIPVPGDSSHTIYVWLDALLNYLTVAKQSQSGTVRWNFKTNESIKKYQSFLIQRTIGHQVSTLLEKIF